MPRKGLKGLHKLFMGYTRLVHVTKNPFPVYNSRESKGSIEPTHESVCSGVRKLQSMSFNVVKLPRTKVTKAD